MQRIGCNLKIKEQSDLQVVSICTGVQDRYLVLVLVSSIKRSDSDNYSYGVLYAHGSL